MKKYHLKKQYKKALIVLFGIAVIVLLTMIYLWRIESVKDTPKTDQSIQIIKK